jgi:hypothetical protein
MATKAKTAESSGTFSSASERVASWSAAADSFSKIITLASLINEPNKVLPFFASDLLDTIVAIAMFATLLVFAFRSISSTGLSVIKTRIR